MKLRQALPPLDTSFSTPAAARKLLRLLVNDTTAPGGGGGLAGVISNGNDPDSCNGLACPVGNATMYYAGVNDGSVTISRDGGAFQLNSLSYAFLPPLPGSGPYSFGQLTRSPIAGSWLNIVAPLTRIMPAPIVTECHLP